MRKNTLHFLTVLLIIISVYSYFNIPVKYEIEGGSCYQGIAVMIIRFFIKVCGVLSLISILALYSKSRFKIAKILSVVSLVIWSLGTIIHSCEDTMMGIKFFSPLLIWNIVFVKYIFRKSENTAL